MFLADHFFWIKNVLEIDGSKFLFLKYRTLPGIRPIGSFSQITSLKMNYTGANVYQFVAEILANPTMPFLRLKS